MRYETHDYVKLRKILLVCDMCMGVYENKEHPYVQGTHPCVLLKKIDFRDSKDRNYIFEN